MTLAVRKIELDDELLAGREVLPKEAPLDMPVQRLDAWNGEARRVPARVEVTLARLFVFGLAGAITALGTYEVYAVVNVSEPTALQVVFAALFAVTFAWIAFSCASAILGFLRLCLAWPVNGGGPSDGPMGRNVLLMPVYEEDAERVALNLESMACELAEAGAVQSFDIFVLSDTRDEVRAELEWASFSALRRRLAGTIQVYYRRREHNTHRKAGNIADFVRRFGGAYDHMIVLDADSYMRAGAVVGLARAIAANPRAGIIQSLPVLWNRSSLFARMLQFSSRVYAPVIASGLASWHGRDGNYYGHNAIIRVRAFAESAGLPELRGRKPFGGHILSHDFVEAALMRRAGWEIYMLPELEGSYEECPPTLIDLAIRDRRWAQGNLQHIAVLRASGLSWVSRVHLLQGVMAYLASPLWLMLIVCGFLLSLQAQFVTPGYFPDSYVLFPQWPIIDSERALRLFGLTMAVLFLPKVLGTVAAVMNSRLRRGLGGAGRVLASVAAETVLSALIAPVLMVVQSRFVAEILCGRDSGWSAQNRDDCDPPWPFVLSRHIAHVCAGVALGVAATAVSLATLLWLAPVVLGLILSALLSWYTAQTSAGTAARRHRLFLVPEESETMEKESRVRYPIRIVQPAE